MCYKDKMLLVKMPKDVEKPYVRKNPTWNLFDFETMVAVNKQNRACALAIRDNKQNGVAYVPATTKNEEIIQTITLSKLSKAKESDLFGLYYMPKREDFYEYVELDKKVMGVRIATKEEKEKIKKQFIGQKVQELGITFSHVLYHDQRYKDLYFWCMEHGFEGALFDVTRNGV